MSSFEKFLKKSKSAGKFLKMTEGDSHVYELACTPRECEPKEGKYGESVEIKLVDPETGEKKVWNVKKYKILAVLAKCEEGDEVRIGKNDDNQWTIKAKGVKIDDEDESEDSDEEEEETPKKKKKHVEEDEAPKKKKSKKSSDNEDEEDEESDEEDEDEDDEVDPADVDF